MQKLLHMQLLSELGTPSATLTQGPRCLEVPRNAADLEGDGSLMIRLGRVTASGRSALLCVSLEYAGKAS